MINIGELDFHIGVPSLPKEELESYSTDLFDKWERYLADSLNLSDFSLSLEVEDGSIKGRAKIGTALLVLYIGIGQYGSFINGLQTINNQVKEAGEYLSETAQSPHRGTQTSYKVHRKSGALGQLERLFSKVKKNELTVDEAMVKAKIILGEEADSSPEFVNDLKESLQHAPKDPEQLKFGLEDEEENPPPEKKDPKPRSSRTPQENPVPTLHNHIEIWRETKKGKKEIRVTQI
jgi:hypothetical protein